MRSLALGVLALGVSLASVGCGAAGPEAQPNTSRSISSSVSIIGGQRAQDEILSAIVAQTSSPGLKSIRVGPAPAEASKHPFAVAGSDWVTFEYVVDGLGAPEVESFWRSAIAATAFRRASLNRGLAPIQGYTVIGRTADGLPVQEESFPIMADAFASNPTENADALRARLEGNQSPSFRVVALDVLEPDGAAPVITVEVTDARAFIRGDSDDFFELTGDLSPYEGYLIRVVEPAGELVWIQGSALRAGQTLTWRRPDLQIEP